MSNKKKVLIITYYWPPAGGISVLRSLKIAKYLRDYGWEPIVYTVENAEYPIIDESNYRHIPEGITILKTKTFEFFELFKKITGRNKSDTLQNVLYIGNKKKGWLDKVFIWIRGNFFIPDARLLWIKPSIRYLTRYLKENPVNAIFSDGPPHTNTLIACRVSKATGTPWLADFQDPWTQVDYYKDFMITKWADRKHKRLEQECINQASKITIVTNSWKKDLESIGAKNVSVIPWGYDDEDYIEVGTNLSSKFLVSHVGILGIDRMPETLLKVLSDLCKEVSGFRSHLQVRFIGSVDHTLKKYIQEVDLEDSVDIVSHIPRKQALSEIFNSQVLLLLINKADNGKGRMPAKLFEYLKAGRPILCLGSQDNDVAKILKETNSGESIEYDEYNELKRTLSNYYSLFVAKKLVLDQRNIEKYSIRKMTGEFAKYLDELLNNENE